MLIVEHKCLWFIACLCNF